MRLKALSGMSMMDLSHARRVGSISDLWIDPDVGKIVALDVRTGQRTIQWPGAPSVPKGRMRRGRFGLIALGRARRALATTAACAAGCAPHRGDHDDHQDEHDHLTHQCTSTIHVNCGITSEAKALRASQS